MQEINFVEFFLLEELEILKTVDSVFNPPL